MSQSVLVIDTPQNCYCCIFCYQYDYENEYDGYCRLYKNYKIINEYYDYDSKLRPDWCPLKPLPEEDHENHYPDEWEDGYADGWNACLREITGQPNINS